ncbi:MAG: hypothetical protein D6712_19720 [Chloroflexi bacterium]|nr:MAG: hypothetical protein D6712_19720 [Chloroflexota bacterium]
MDREEALARATEVQARYADMLMGKKHVVGVGVGLRKRGGELTQEIALVVMVEKKLPEDELDPEDLLPKELDGVPIDVQETGTIEAL